MHNITHKIASTQTKKQILNRDYKEEEEEKLWLLILQSNPSEYVFAQLNASEWSLFVQDDLRLPHSLANNSNAIDHLCHWRPLLMTHFQSTWWLYDQVPQQGCYHNLYRQHQPKRLDCQPMESLHNAAGGGKMPDESKLFWSSLSCIDYRGISSTSCGFGRMSALEKH